MSPMVPYKCFHFLILGVIWIWHIHLTAFGVTNKSLPTQTARVFCALDAFCNDVQYKFTIDYDNDTDNT